MTFKYVPGMQIYFFLIFLGTSDTDTMPPIDPRWTKAKRFPVHAAVDR